MAFAWRFTLFLTRCIRRRKDERNDLEIFGWRKVKLGGLELGMAS